MALTLGYEQFVRYTVDEYGRYISKAGEVEYVPNGMFDVRSFGASCDGIGLYNVTTTNSTTCTIVDSDANGLFTSDDVGKACVVIPATANAANAKWGTITSVTDGNTIVATISGAPGALTGATFLYGTDDTVAVKAAIAAANTVRHKGCVFFPSAITIVTDQLIIPDGVDLSGAGNTKRVTPARNFRHLNSSLVLAKYNASGFVLVGDGASSGIYGQGLYDMNIDCMNLAAGAILVNSTTVTKAVHMNRVTAIRGVSYTAALSASGVTSSCIFVQQQAAHVVVLSGDNRFSDNYVFGAGNGYHNIKCSGVGDVQIIGNHIWKDSDTATALGSAIYINNYGADAKHGQITVSGNSFDTSFGPHILIEALSTSTLRGITITGNEGFQNDSVPNATYPFIKINADVGATIRALTITGNVGVGSWNDPTKGQYTYFVDGSGVAGNVYGSVTGGNAIDNCAALYNFSATWTAWDHDMGNIVIAGTGTTVTKSTTT